MSISFCQNIHLYQSLTHAQGEFLNRRFEKALGASRSGFMGRIFGRIFEFSDFSGFPSDFGLMNSELVPYTSAVFPNAMVGFQYLHYGQILAILGRIRWPEFWFTLWVFRVFTFSGSSP